LSADPAIVASVRTSKPILTAFAPKLVQKTSTVNQKEVDATALAVNMRVDNPEATVFAPVLEPVVVPANQE